MKPEAEAGLVTPEEVTGAALAAQKALLPYALATFAVGLPIFVWAGSHAPNAQWMAGVFVAFAIAWGGFYAASDALKRTGLSARALPMFLICGLLWAGAVGAMAAFALGSGPAREPLLALALAAAALVTFFAAPALPCLLLVAPLAFAGPLVGLLADPESRGEGVVGWGFVALSMALALLVNRILRRQFTLAAEADRLARESADALGQARALNESKSVLLATLSQDVRSGLSAVSQVLSAAVSPEGRASASREQISAALTATTKLLRTLDSTLDNERLAAGGLTVAMRPVNAAGLLRDLAADHRAAAGEKGLELELHIAPELARGAVIADPARLAQVLTHLVANAVAYTVRGRVELRLTPGADGHAVIAVADTGPGLTADELAAAREPFRRIERTAAGLPGAGLGLSLAARLAALMGADLLAESAPGVGSCFSLSLAHDPDAVVQEAGPEPGAKGGWRVLLVQSDALAAAEARAMLGELGHGVVVAQDGRRALDLVKAGDFDLFIVDADIQGLAGPSVMRRLKGAPVMALIDADPRTAETCAAAGAAALIRKPATVPALALAIAEATATRQKSPEAA